MRTVSFSDRQVRDLLNSNFVNTYTNTEGDPTAGQSIAHRPNDQPGNCIRGNGKQNVQTIFMTPTGEIFHVATGFLSPQDLATEIKFAQSLFSDLAKVDNSDMAKAVAEAHSQRLNAEGFTRDQIQNQNPMGVLMSQANNLQANNGQGVFDGFIKQQFLNDNRFSMNHPLMSWKRLERDPTPLVGNGKSFFGSSSSSSSF